MMMRIVMVCLLARANAMEMLIDENNGEDDPEDPEMHFKAAVITAQEAENAQRMRHEAEPNFIPAEIFKFNNDNFQEDDEDDASLQQLQDDLDNNLKAERLQLQEKLKHASIIQKFAINKDIGHFDDMWDAQRANLPKHVAISYDAEVPRRVTGDIKQNTLIGSPLGRIYLALTSGDRPFSFDYADQGTMLENFKVLCGWNAQKHVCTSNAGAFENAFAHLDKRQFNAFELPWYIFFSWYGAAQYAFYFQDLDDLGLTPKEIVEYRSQLNDMRNAPLMKFRKACQMMIDYKWVTTNKAQTSQHIPAWRTGQGSKRQNFASIFVQPWSAVTCGAMEKEIKSADHAEQFFRPLGSDDDIKKEAELMQAKIYGDSIEEKSAEQHNYIIVSKPKIKTADMSTKAYNVFNNKRASRI